MDLNDIKKTMDELFDKKTWNKLSDKALMKKFMATNSFKKEKKKLVNILAKYNFLKESKSVINDYKENLIQPGTKGVVRGNEFNKIVQKKIKSLKLGGDFDVQFEKNIPKFQTSEVPDFYIIQKSTNKIMIGMNQIDMWTGGQQTNRLSKYVNMNKDMSQIKYVLLVAKQININLKTKKNKVDILLEKALKDNSIHYITSIKKEIQKFFNIQRS